MVILDAESYWEACQDYYRTGYTTLLNTLVVLEKNPHVRIRVERLLSKIDKEKIIESS